MSDFLIVRCQDLDGENKQYLFCDSVCEQEYFEEDDVPESEIRRIRMWSSDNEEEAEEIIRAQNNFFGRAACFKCDDDLDTEC